jgi:hypothetical protein
VRNVCQVDVLVGPRDKRLPPADVARRLFGELQGCRVLTAVIVGPRVSVSLLLPEMRGGYSNPFEVKDVLELALAGKGAVLASVHSLREATPLEMLERVLTRKNGR